MGKSFVLCELLMHPFNPDAVARKLQPHRNEVHQRPQGESAEVGPSLFGATNWPPCPSLWASSPSLHTLRGNYIT